MSVLGDILRRKRADVAARKEALPLSSFARELTRADRDLGAALGRPRTGLILECKAASPSGGVLRQSYDPAAIARSYAPFADAISVVTDEPFFGGRPEHLAAVRQAAPCPVLCKDFVVEPYQVFEARRHGADGILLMLSVLTDAEWTTCAEACRELGMTPLTEVHSGAELRRALALGAPVIGINNRNLANLEVDLKVTETLAPGVGPDRLVVCESGIRDHQDILRLGPLVDAFLVGTALMKAADLDAATRGLAFGPVKICGLTRPEDARVAHGAGATWGGMIFAEASPRWISFETAQRLREAAPLGWVGVWVNAPPDQVARAADRLGLAAVQLHGEEDEAYVALLRQRLPPGCEVWKAQRVSDSSEILPRAEVDRILVDTWHPAAQGGTGQAFDWTGLASHPDKARLVLAGGISLENVACADALGCGALDVNSGAEAGTPGRKDQARLTALFQGLRGPGREKPR